MRFSCSVFLIQMEKKLICNEYECFYGFKLGAYCVIKFSEDEKTHGKQNGFVYSTKTELDLKKKIWLAVM